MVGAADYADPDTILRLGSWLRGWDRHSAEHEALVEGAWLITARWQQLAMCRQAERILVEEAPALPIAYGLDNVLIKPWFDPWPSSKKCFILKDVIMREY